jgi:plasmid stability protein
LFSHPYSHPFPPSLPPSPSHRTQGKLAKRGLRAVADAALTLRNLPPATDAELAAIAAAASPGFEAQRRLSLLECVQGEMMELLVLLDRALALRDAGHAVDVVAAFGLSASDRNLAILANCSRRGGDDEPRRTSGFSSGT